MARRVLLVAEERFLKAVGKLPEGFEPVALGELAGEALVASLAEGAHLVWIGRGEALPRELWLGVFQPTETELALTQAEGSPVLLPELAFQPARAQSAFISPPGDFPRHNLDEELRFDLEPILEARDRFGQVVGYPGVLVNHYAPSLVGKRFGGSQQIFFLFEEPLAALDLEGWQALLGALAQRFESGLQVVELQTNYASSKPGERVQARLRVANSRPRARALEARWYAQAPGEEGFSLIERMRRVAPGEGETEAVLDFLPQGEQGLWRLRVEVAVDLVNAEKPTLVGGEEPLLRQEIGFTLLADRLETEVGFAIEGPCIEFEGRKDFWVGTHYYPSSGWLDWPWRDFRPVKVETDFAAIRRAGYRLVRVWVDPVLDEVSLRALDAEVWLAAQHGLVLDICLFSQWVREMGFERASGEKVLWDFRTIGDFNIYSLSLRHLELQKEYVATLGSRYARAGNVIWNLANEAYVKDPDESQMDPAVRQWEEARLPLGLERDTLLFQRWARELTTALREAGARQPVVPGYLFSLAGGGDAYLGNAEAELAPWHSYMPPRWTAMMSQYLDPIGSDRPLFIEEFGAAGWNPTAHYEANAQYGLAGGAAALMSYEWGVSWLAREQCYWYQPLREILGLAPDERWFEPLSIYAKEATFEEGAGLCAWPSGFGYGTLHNGTPFPASAAVALGRWGLMGQGLGRRFQAEEVYVLAPAGRQPDYDAFHKVITDLWRAKVVFGVWQEALLEALPETSRVLICPAGVGPDKAATLERFHKLGVEVYEGYGEEWRSSERLPRVTVEPGEDVDALVRRTVGGTLYGLFAEGPSRRVKLAHEGHTVELGLAEYAMAEEIAGGFRLIEGSGELRVDGELLCEVERGRLIVASDEGKPLGQAREASAAGE